MRVPAAHIGLGRFQLAGLSDPVPPSDGVSVETARAACATAKGTWDAGAGGCRLPGEGPNIAAVRDFSSCSWWKFTGPESCWNVPLFTPIGAELPTADDLAALSAYTAYKIAQKPVAGCQPTYSNGRMIPPPANCTTTGAQAAQTIMDTAQADAQYQVAGAGCEYAAALNHPVLSQVVGPSLACGLTDPFDADHYGWLVYAAIAAVGVVAVLMLMGGRR